MGWFENNWKLEKIMLENQAEDKNEQILIIIRKTSINNF